MIFQKKTNNWSSKISINDQKITKKVIAINDQFQKTIAIITNDHSPPMILLKYYKEILNKYFKEQSRFKKTKLLLGTRKNSSLGLFIRSNKKFKSVEWFSRRFVVWVMSCSSLKNIGTKIGMTPLQSVCIGLKKNLVTFLFWNNS